MAYTRTFAQLSLAVQQLGEWERSEDVTPAVLLQAINYGLLEGYDHMVQKWAEYYTTLTTFAITPGTSSYSIGVIASNFYKLRHLEYTRETGALTPATRFHRMRPFDVESAYSFRSDSDRVPKYRFQGGSFVLSSSPAGTVRMHYIPLAPQFATVADVTAVTFDVPVEERLVVLLAELDIRHREELDTGTLERRIERTVAQLRTAADSRDAAEPFYLDPRGPPRGDWDFEDDY